MKSLPIRLRLTLWHTLLLAVLLTSFSVFVYLSMTRSLHAQVDAGLRLVAGQIMTTIQDEDGWPGFQNSDTAQPGSTLLATRGFALRLITEKGTVIGGTGNYRRLPPGPPSEGLATVFVDEDSWRIYTTLIVASTADGAAGQEAQGPMEAGVTPGRAFLQVAQSLAGVNEAQDRLGGLLLAGVLLGLILAGAGGVFLADRALRPIDAITRQASRIGAETLDGRPRDPDRRLGLALPADEVGRLARTFDEMLDRLREAFRRERQFTADAAHELRTPLTVLKGSIGVTRRRSRTKAHYEEVLAEAEAEVDRLISLSEDLLLLARTERLAGVMSAATPTADMAIVAASAVDRLRPLAQAKGVSLSLDLALPGPLMAAGDPSAFGRVIYNLVHNAIKFSQPGGLVAIEGSVANDGRTVRVRVTDSGCGIAPEDLPHIFDRFYRADRARRRVSGDAPDLQGGVGLGLTLARSLARAFGGDITAESTPGRGSLFTVLLPRP